MATEIIRPDDDISVGSWTVSPLWSKIEESSPDSTVIGTGVTTTCEIRMGNVSSMGASDICSAIQISAYTSMTALALDVLAAAYKTGSTSSYKDITGPEVSYAWSHVSWTGLSLTQTEVNDLRLMLQNTSYGAGTSYVDTAYMTITYTVSGYGHDYMGVPAANIDNVNGVPTANIDNIKGV